MRVSATKWSLTSSVDSRIVHIRTPPTVGHAQFASTSTRRLNPWAWPLDSIAILSARVLRDAATGGFENRVEGAGLQDKMFRDAWGLRSWGF